MNKKRILHVIVGGGFTGGIEKFLVRYYSVMNREHVAFDFAFCVDNSMSKYMNDQIFIDSHFYNLAAIESENRSVNQYRNLIKRARLLLKKNHYDTVEIHSGSLRIQLVWILCCIGNGIPNRIAHSHSMPPPRKQRFLKLFIDDFSRKIITLYYTSLFSCSTDAGVHLFGRSGIKNQKFHLIRNTIDVNKYTFSDSIRNKYRELLAFNDAFVFLQIGYFEKVKNHSFILDVYSEVLKHNPNCLLVFCGEGSLENSIRNKVRDLGIEDKVFFLGFRNDIEFILQASDCLVLPSLQEGFPYVAIEAQATGLTVVCSETVPHEVDLTGQCMFVPLIKNAWVEELKKLASISKKRVDQTCVIREKGFDILEEANKLESFYLTGSFNDN